MATYNGTKTLTKQVQSILKQLTFEDELIVIDDCSQDATLTLIQTLTADFVGQVIIKQNAINSGPIKSFEKALALATGDIIMLSDQDDEWYADKVERVCTEFKVNNADLVVHDAVVIGRQGEQIDGSWNHYNHNDVHQNILGNFIKNGYTGAMMATSRRLLDVALPFPNEIEMHDQWLFLVAKKKRFKIVVIEESLMAYVRHGGNVTGMTKRSKREMLIGRYRMFNNYLRLRR